MHLDVSKLGKLRESKGWLWKRQPLTHWGLGPFYWHDLALTWISNYTHYTVWDEITYLLAKLNGETVEVWGRDFSWSMLVIPPPGHICYVRFHFCLTINQGSSEERKMAFGGDIPLDIWLATIKLPQNQMLVQNLQHLLSHVFASTFPMILPSQWIGSKHS